MKAYALYRFPHDSEFVTLISHTSAVALPGGYAEVGIESGFVLAPFALSAETPVMLIRPDEVHRTSFPLEHPDTDNHHTKRRTHAATVADRARYQSDFQCFSQWLRAEKGEKIVLARSMQISVEEPQEQQLFLKACRQYPRLFVALVHTEHTGTWLMATPEVLLERQNSMWHTMALAGTMKLKPSQHTFDTPFSQREPQPAWSDKNIREQQYVSNYIKDCLHQFTPHVKAKGPYTRRAANLVHLCSDFSFELPPKVSIGKVITALHPTPAVCGIPKREAYHFILENESVARRYYSGFAGPVNVQNETRLFVTLRCMALQKSTATLYAGGGLLPESVEETEWQETEAKMQTMRKLL